MDSFAKGVGETAVAVRLWDFFFWEGKKRSYGIGNLRLKMLAGVSILGVFRVYDTCWEKAGRG